MPSRHLTRIALHLLLAVALVVPGIAAPVQAIAEGLHTIDAALAKNAMAMGDAPCDEADMPGAAPSEPCDCCNPQACDFSACLGVACLPQLPRVAAQVPPAAAPLLWQQPVLPPGVADTPLRPPIA